MKKQDWGSRGPRFIAAAAAVILAASEAEIRAQGSPPAGSPPSQGTPSPAAPAATSTHPAAAAAVRLLEGIGGGLRVYLAPETSGSNHADANGYLLADKASGEAAIIDAGARSGPLLLRQAGDLGLRVSLLVSTHFHPDHTGGNALILSKTSAQMAAPAKEEGLLTGAALTPADRKALIPSPPTTPRVDVKLKSGDELKLGEHAAKVIEIPGHSPGGVCLHFPKEGLLFTGDALLKGTIGRTGLPHGAKTPEGAVKEIRARLLPLPDETIVLPGHGPTTTIAAEKAGNPWLKSPAKSEKKTEKGKTDGGKKR